MMHLPARQAAFGAALLSVGLQAGILQQDRPQFRATTTAVAIPVVVRNNGRPVLDLQTTDFVLTDSGVAQEISAVGAAGIPIDLSLVVQESTPADFGRVALMRDEIDEAARLLGTDDRLRVVSAGGGLAGVVELLPLSNPSDITTRSLVPGPSCHALYDALASVLVRPPSPGRQHVVIAFTWHEGGGAIALDVVEELARRTDARVHILIRGDEVRDTSWPTWGRRPVCTGAWDASDPILQARLDRLNARQDGNGIRQLIRDRLLRIAAVTGGGEIRPAFWTRSISAPVRQVLDEVRSSYVLYYVPSGVPDRGWHPVEVTVVRPGRFEVRARPGYAR